MERSKYLKFFDEIGIDDVPLVGGKNASLGEMYRKLSEQGVRVPNGFAITAEGYRLMLEEAGAWGPLHCILDELRPDDVADLARRAKIAREIVYGAGIPDRLADEIRSAYAKLRKQYGDDVSLAVRSSATAEDLPTASFAGQQDTFLNVQRRAEPPRRLSALLRQPVHRSRDPLSGRPGLRPLQGRSLDRRDEDGPL